MRVSRYLPVVAAGALVAATVAPASAATSGVGSTTGSLTAIALDAGDLLRLDLLSDVGSATNDPADGTPAASAALRALGIEQPTTGIDEKISVFEVQSTGAPDTDGQNTAVPIDNPLVSGSVLPTLLGAEVDPDPLAGVITGVGDLAVLGGLLSVSSTDSDLGSSVLAGGAEGERQLAIDAISLLDLEALLAGLGIPLTSLPVDTLLDLVDSLGIGGLDQLLAQLDAALTELDSLLTELGLDGTPLGELPDLGSLPGVIDDVVDEVDDLTGGLDGGTGGLGLAQSDVGAAALVDDVAAQIEVVEGLLGDVLGEALDVLAGQSLVSLAGLDVSVLTKSTGDLATSVADVTANLGALQVGDITVPLGDVISTAEQVQAAVAQVEATVDQVLGVIDLSLADLVDIGLLEEQTSVRQADDGSVVSTATFNGLRADVLPITAELTSFISSLASVESVGDVLGGLGLPVPDPLTVLPLESVLGATPVGDLSGLLEGTAVLELIDGVSLRTASMTQESAFVLSSTATPGTPGTPGSTPQLPTTGSNDTVLMLIAAVAAAGALGIRRWTLSRD